MIIASELTGLPELPPEHFWKIEDEYTETHHYGGYDYGSYTSKELTGKVVLAVKKMEKYNKNEWRLRWPWLPFTHKVPVEHEREVFVRTIEIDLESVDGKDGSLRYSAVNLRKQLNEYVAKKAEVLMLKWDEDKIRAEMYGSYPPKSIA